MERVGSSHGRILGDNSDNRQYEVRVFIDDVLTTVLYAPVATTLWPRIIGEPAFWPFSLGAELIYVMN
jgi:hypothetical protein